MAKVLIIEDDPYFATTVRDWLANEHYDVEVVEDGAKAQDMLRSSVYDLLILDWKLPKLEGIDVCKSFRATGGTTPILMITGKSEVAAKESGLDAGADDYLTKPFHVRELSARVRALLRRPKTLTDNVLKVGNVVLDQVQHTVTCDGGNVDVTPREFAVLEFFMRYPNRIFDADALLDRVWKSTSCASDLTIRTCIKNLRKKLYPSIIQNIHGVGYKLEKQYDKADMAN